MTIKHISALFLSFALWQGISFAQAQPSGKAYQTGNYIFCGNEIPKKFAYVVERKTDDTWKPIAHLKAPQSEAECRADFMQLPKSLAIISPIDKTVIAFVWNTIQQADVVDSLFAYSIDPRYQYLARTAWFDEEIREPGTYTYRVRKVQNNGTVLSSNEVKVKFPSTEPVSNISPVRFVLKEKSISISYSIDDLNSISGIKLFRSTYLRNSFSEIPVELMYTQQKGEMVAVLTDKDASKGLTYSYVALPYDALGNLGKTTDTLNIHFLAKPADVGLVTNLQVTPDPERGGNNLKWDFNYKMNANTIDIYRSASYDGPYMLITSLNPKTKEYFDSRNIQPSIAYYYYISINTGIGQSLPSARVPAILEGKKPNPFTPQNLSTSREGNVVTLKFRKLGYDTKSYYVFRGDGYVAPLKQLPRMLTSSDSLLTYIDTLPKTINSMVYSYAVASVNSSYNISPLSDRVSVSYSGGRLPVAEKVNAMIHADNILVTWSDAASLHAGISGYRVFRKATLNNSEVEPETLIATTSFSQNSYTDSNVQPNRYYSYRIQCIGSDTLDAGSISMPGGIAFKTDKLLQPGDVTAIPSDGKIILKWSLPLVDGLSSSLIYRSIENSEPILLKEIEKPTDLFEDNSAKKNIQYYYFIVLKYNDNRTSTPTDAVGGKWQ
ncbi:MAG: fibronectin type III domain-containing protein [Bacteroidales bacterium]|nr:fibronectin type III domain-containing protein [Bacteroidales bacterium]